MRDALPRGVLLPDARDHGGEVSAGYWLAAALLLAAYFGFWWQHLRPGVFSFDSGFYLGEVTSGRLTNLKPYLYARFLQVVTLGGARLEWAAVAQAALVVLGFSRMLAIALATRARWPWIAGALVLMLNPYVANMTFYVQNDVLFSIAIVTLLVETLYVARRGAIGRATWLVVAVFAPMAFLFRQNGLLFLPLWGLVVLVLVPRRQWASLLGPAAITSAIAFASMAGVARGGPGEDHDLLFPAVIHEVANISRPALGRGMGSALSEQTRSAIAPDRLSLATNFYRPMYWDTIAFFPGGPMLIELPAPVRTRIVRSFVRRDLWPNLPAVLGHRLEMFLGACLARAELAGPYDAPANLPASLGSLKSSRVAQHDTAGLAARINRWSIASRAWTWNALLGVAVLVVLSLGAVWRRDRLLLGCCLLLWIQAAAVFLFAPSAEYRYVLALYLAPLLLLVGPQRAAPRLATEARDAQA